MFGLDHSELDCSKAAETLCRSAEENVLAPLFNAAFIEPCNTVSDTVSRLSGHSQAFRFKSLAVERCQPYSGQYWLQNIAQALGSVVPYALAGKFAGGNLRAYKLSESEAAAQVAGAAFYDWLRTPNPGETRAGNAAGSAVAFGIFEGGNRLAAGTPLAGKLLLRPLTGAFGATAQLTVSHGAEWLAGKTPRQEELILAAVTGATLSSALPFAQEGLRRVEDSANLALKLGIPAERHIAINYRLDQTQTVRFELEPLLARNRWARVQSGAEQTAYFANRDMITLSNGQADLKLLIHELTHRAETRARIAEPGFELASKRLAEGDEARAWQTYRAVRLAQETRARLAEERAALALDPTHPVLAASTIASSVPTLKLSNGKTYEQIWQAEFLDFKSTGGQFRPEIDFSDAAAGKFLWLQRARLLSSLSRDTSPLTNLMKKVEGRSDLDWGGTAELYRNLNRLIEDNKSIPERHSKKLAVDVLKLVADPKEVSQGKHPTCGPAALEYVIYKTSPLSAVQLVSQVARFGSYIAGDGTEIRLSALNLKPELELWDRPNYASQLFQTTAINTHWQRQNNFLRWVNPDTLIYKHSYKGFLSYERQSTSNLNESPYRLIDSDRQPARPLIKPESDLRNIDPADPYMNGAALDDIYHQIVGRREPHVSLDDGLSSVEALGDQLKNAKDRGTLPVIIGIDIGNKPFKADLGSPDLDGGHFIVITDYNPANGHVDIFNPWGREYQPDGLSLQELWLATLPLRTKI
jgi:hypothetical protein